MYRAGPEAKFCPFKSRTISRFVAAGYLETLPPSKPKAPVEMINGALTANRFLISEKLANLHARGIRELRARKAA